MKISILKKPREEEWLMVKKAAFRTIGKDTEKLPSIEWKRRMLKAQHSPIRMLEYTFLLEGIPSWVSVHLVRHVHATPFVTTQRNDRMDREEGYDRRKASQDTPVDMIWFVNAEELITIAHKRLCMLASPETRKVVQDICKAVLRECPEWQGTRLLVPLCTYRNGLCDEFKPCDYYMKHGHGYVNSGAALAKALGIGTVVKPQAAIVHPTSGYFVNPDGRPYTTAKYLSVTTGHHDWGNDSIDSVETHDICSTECLSEFMQEFYSTFNRPNALATDYIHIDSETDYVYPECPPLVEKE